MKIKSIMTLITTIILLSACVPMGIATPAATELPAATPTTLPPTSLPTEAVPTETHVPTDRTPAQLAALQAVSKKYNIPIEKISLDSTEAVTWPNGCLGVVIPGVMCTDMVTQGFRIQLSSNGQQFEMHTNQDGTSVIDAAEQLATLNFVVYTSDRAVKIVNPSIALGPTYNPAFNGLLPAGGAILGTAYVLDFTDKPKVLAVNAAGSTELSFVQNPSYGLAIWRGGEGSAPMLAWGTQVSSETGKSDLLIASPDGSNLETVYSLTSPVSPGASQLVAEYWSADGQTLYFSQEPVGLGGYILFGGASNLYKIDIQTKEFSEVIPQTPADKPQACLDAVSGDYRYVAEHCTQGVITIRDLQAGTSVSLEAPDSVTGYRLAGSARFSPTGDRVAYALAQGDPTNERGWVAVGNSSGGASTLLLAGDAGSYYTVLGWLDDQTLLVQSNSIVCSPACGNQLFTVGADGSNPTKVGDGSLLTIIDNR